MDKSGQCDFQTSDVSSISYMKRRPIAILVNRAEPLRWFSTV